MTSLETSRTVPPQVLDREAADRKAAPNEGERAAKSPAESDSGHGRASPDPLYPTDRYRLMNPYKTWF